MGVGQPSQERVRVVVGAPLRDLELGEVGEWPLGPGLGGTIRLHPGLELEVVSRPLPVPGPEVTELLLGPVLVGVTRLPLGLGLAVVIGRQQVPDLAVVVRRRGQDLEVVTERLPGLGPEVVIGPPLELRLEADSERLLVLGLVEASGLPLELERVEVIELLPGRELGVVTVRRRDPGPVEVDKPRRDLELAVTMVRLQELQRVVNDRRRRGLGHEVLVEPHLPGIVLEEVGRRPQDVDLHQD